jgi:rod shape-determining protein MreD
MNKVISAALFILLSIVFIILQSTLFSPRNLGVFHPDLNLIWIIFLSLFSEVRGSAIIALGNGYMMDVLSGHMFGIYTLSRLSVFAILKGFSMNVYSQSGVIQGVAIFLGTLFAWGFIWAVLEIKSNLNFGISFLEVFVQSVVNTIVGIPLFWVIKRVNAKI